MNKRSSEVQIIVAGLILLASLGGIVVCQKQQQGIDDQTRAAQIVLNKKQDELRKVPDQVEAQIAKENPNLESAKQHAMTQKIKSNGDIMFKLLYNIDPSMNNAKLKVRQATLQNYATKQALIKTGLFGLTQKQNKQYNLSSTFEDAHISVGLPNAQGQVPGVAQIDYEQSSNQQSSQEAMQQVYLLTYDTKQNKFTQIQLLGMSKDVQD